MWAIAKKDFKVLFYSPIGYIVTAIFLASMGIIMYLSTVGIRAIDFNTVYEYIAKFVLPILIGLLTMKSFSEEKNKDTDKILFTASSKIAGIIIGKIIAIVMAIGVSVLLSLVYCLLYAKFGAINSRLLITIACFMLLVVAYASVGVMISSLTENQIIAALFTILFLLLPSFFSFGTGAFSYLALSEMYSLICEGLFSINILIALITFSITCILLTYVEMIRNKKLN
ncbi:MAG: ABC transporter permease subunit [Bacilli bacterium]|nr:ABC transporter permease subunit [Clostridia bacterium]MBR3490280.1 ABC transporter permease subunit [Bacilli bacterium]